MTKKADREAILQKRLAVLVGEFPDSTPERIASMVKRYESGKTGPAMKRIDRVMREANLAR